MENRTMIDGILSLIAEKLEGIDYALIGSVNLYIQGSKINPRDIDILTTSEGIKKIDKIFNNYRTREIYFDKSEGRNSFRSFYKIDGTEIEVLGNVNNAYRKPESLKNRIYIKFGVIKLPCIPLADEMMTYKLMGRMNKVDMIEKFLQRSNRIKNPQKRRQ